MHQTKEQALHPYNLEQATIRFKRDHIHNVLELNNWNLEATARMLGIGLHELKQKIDTDLSELDQQKGK